MLKGNLRQAEDGKAETENHTYIDIVITRLPGMPNEEVKTRHNQVAKQRHQTNEASGCQRLEILAMGVSTPHVGRPTINDSRTHQRGIQCFTFAVGQAYERS